MKRFALAALVAAFFMSLPCQGWAQTATPPPTTSRTYINDVATTGANPTPAGVSTQPYPTTRLVVTVGSPVSETNNYSFPVNFDPTQPAAIVVNYTPTGMTAPAAANLTTSTGQSISFSAIYINGYSLTVNTAFTPTTPGMATLATTLTQTVPAATTAGH